MEPSALRPKSESPSNQGGLTAVMKHFGEAQEVQSLGGRGSGMRVGKGTAQNDTLQ